MNVGFEYVTLQEQHRHRFLQNVIELRFEYVGAPVDLATILPPPGLDRQYRWRGRSVRPCGGKGDFITTAWIRSAIFAQATSPWGSIWYGESSNRGG